MNSNDLAFVIGSLFTSYVFGYTFGASMLYFQKIVEVSIE